MAGHWIRANRIVRELKTAFTRIERHEHEIFHFLYCMDGGAIAYVNGEFHELQKDDAILISPHVEHAFYVRNSFLSIEAKFHCDSELENELSKVPYLLRHHDFDSAWIMREIIDETLKGDAYFEDIINAYLLVLMYSLLRPSDINRGLRSHDYRYQLLSSHSGKDDWLSSVIDYIENNLTEPMSAKSVASHFGYESGYFSNLFREKFSYPLSRYINDRKIEMAKEMLMEGHSVTEVAEALGFSSIHHFSKRFKAAVGVPPAKFSERVGVQLAVNVSGDKRFPPTGLFEYKTKPWDGEHFI